jgi:hypothetical protein
MMPFHWHVADLALKQVRSKQQSVRSVSINVRSLSGLPRRDEGGRSQHFFAGAVSIGAFEVSRWRLRRTR